MAKQEWWDEERKTWIDSGKEPLPSGPIGRRKVVMIRGGPNHSVVDYSCEVRADGSSRIKANGPEDHARAMEAHDRAQALLATVPITQLGGAFSDPISTLGRYKYGDKVTQKTVLAAVVSLLKQSGPAPEALAQHLSEK